MKVLYEIPIIPNNLREDETIVQIAEIFDYLYDVFDDIITRVNERIEHNKTQVLKLKSRIDSSSEKIVKLMGTKNAIQVFSSSKYPAADVHKKYKSIFTNKDNKNLIFKRSKMKFKNLELTEQPLEKLQFYHVKINDNLNQNAKYVDVETGLGIFPNDIESITELLLYNTSKNPYKNYVVADPLHAFPHVKDTDEVTLTRPDAAPLSISQRAAMNRLAGENYFYSPDLGDVPTIDVPLDLPDLPGVADDLRYIMGNGPAIAPSVTTTPVMPDLPSIVQSPTDISSNIKSTDALANSTPLQSLPIEIDDSNIDEITITEILPSITTETESPKESITPKSEGQIKSDKNLPVIRDARATLMEAIRKAGGAKKANLRMAEPKSEEILATGGNNLMADLHAKLSLRRKGISGVKNSKGYEVNGAMNSISAMIPPPPVKTEPNESTNTEDEDWDE